MDAEEIDWQGGNVAFWNLERISCADPIQAQYRELKEDLAQIEYGADILIDIGWYPEFSPTGRFVVSVISNFDWDTPRFRLECDKLADLNGAIRAAVEAAKK